MPRTSSVRPQQAGADVLVVGDGIIGLSIALGIARAGGSCRVIGRAITGAASSAAAGLLAPSIGAADPAFRAFMRASRDLYPAWLRWLAERTGIEVNLNRSGILAISSTDARLDLERLDHDQLRSLEPALAVGDGAVLYPDDGFVDNVQLLAALQEACRCEWSIDVVDGRIAAIEPGRGGVGVTTEDGRAQRADTLVIAAGAWSTLIVGTPRSLPVEPVRGQMLQLATAPLSHAVASPDAYLVPRGDSTLVGSTLERVGFDTATTSTALNRLRTAACAVVPSLANVEVRGAWAGLRPMTPDGRPIMGRDPDCPAVVYACGHGKNGILLAPITAQSIVTTISGGSAEHDIAPFDISRFG